MRRRDVGVVFDHQHAAAAPATRAAGAAARAATAAPRRERKADDELRAPGPVPALLALTLPPWSSTSPLTSARPRPEPAARAGERAIGLHERLEQPGEQRRLDADAAVRHAQHRRARPDPTTTDTVAVPPARRELDRVRQQVGQHLRDAHAVRVDVDRRARQPRLDAHPVPFEVAGGCPSIVARTSSFRSSRCRCSWILFCVMRVTSSRSSTRRTSWSTCRSMIVRGAHRLFAARRAVLEHVQAEPDRRQRVAQLVRQDGDELALALIGLAQLLRPSAAAR